MSSFEIVVVNIALIFSIIYLSYFVFNFAVNLAWEILLKIFTE